MAWLYRRPGGVLLWILSAIGALTMGLAGVSKFVQQAAWQDRFESWGYAAWFALFIGAVEVLGALLLLVPRVALWAASGLLCIMVGAIYTVLAHPGRFGWGSAAFQIAMLSAIAGLRYLRGRGRARDPGVADRAPDPGGRLPASAKRNAR